MSLARATDLEDVLFDVYDAAPTVESFTLAIPEVEAPSASDPPANQSDMPLFLDLRPAGSDRVRRALGEEGSRWSGYLLFPAQLRALDRETRGHDGLRVTDGSRFHGPGPLARLRPLSGGAP